MNNTSRKQSWLTTHWLIAIRRWKASHWVNRLANNYSTGAKVNDAQLQNTEVDLMYLQREVNFHYRNLVISSSSLRPRECCVLKYKMNSPPRSWEDPIKTTECQDVLSYSETCLVVYVIQRVGNMDYKWLPCLSELLCDVNIDAFSKVTQLVKVFKFLLWEPGALQSPVCPPPVNRSLLECCCWIPFCNYLCSCNYLTTDASSWWVVKSLYLFPWLAIEYIC